jgi:hypothetical protein
MTLMILIALMSDFREAQADESVMISFARYSPRCVEGEFSEVSLGPLWVASLAVLSNLSGNAASKEGKKRACQ